MSITLLNSEIARYLDGLVPPRHPVLAEMEEAAERDNFPIIGPACGQLCYLLARLTGARTIFELGSGFGYSTAWFARAVVENGGGVVHHVVWDAQLSARARDYLSRLNLDGVVRFHVAEAVETLRQTPGPFDLIFNDIDKQGYPESFGVIRERLRPGGLLLVDNLLWSGRVLDEADASPATAGVRELTRMVFNDGRWTASIVPLRDGMLVAQLAQA
jgi:predicted O-methyltransferase YrrM